MTEKEWLGDNSLSLDIWNKKYRNGNETFDQWLDRVSEGSEEIKQLIREKKFIFGGRILANRGITDRSVTYSNCYVISPPEDNLESIFECASKLARTFSFGGGCGTDISKLRPRGAITHNAAKESSGAVSFMDILSTVTGTIAQNGRRGALMISLDINHPDIEEFIDCKTDLSKVNFANISVRMNDEFMDAVDHDRDYILRWPCDKSVEGVEYDKPLTENKLIRLSDGTYVKKVHARDLFNKLVKNNWNYAEPGILYWDAISNYNIVANDPDFTYAGTNPCAEEPLPAGGSCLLGSINLSEFVHSDPLGYSFFNYDDLEDATAKSVVALNKVLMEGMELHPLKEQRDSVYNWRQIGLGTMGLADALIKLKIKYGSKESLDIINEIYYTMARTAVETSLEMAKEFGHYPMCRPELLAESPFIKSLNLPYAIIKDIQEYGLYNSQLLTCAPTGSIGTMLQCSTGVEPIFAMKYTRRTESLHGTTTTYDVYTKIAQDWLDKHPGETLPDYFVESKDIKPIDRVRVQSALQHWIDASISSTTNLPNEATEDDVALVYMTAWKSGCKGITVYRAGCAREGILTVETPKLEESTGTILDTLSPITRDDLGDILVGNTYKNKTACGTLYTTVNKDENGHIVEIFTNSGKNGTCKANLNGETRLASLCFRLGAKVDEVVDALSGIQCQSCAFARAKGHKIDGASCPDIIAKCIKRAYSIDVPKVNTVPTIATVPQLNGEICPECGHTLDHTGGCKTCPECGWSKCN